MFVFLNVLMKVQQFDSMVSKMEQTVIVEISSGISLTLNRKSLHFFSFHYDYNGLELARSSCNIRCPGDPSKKCGGAKALNLFSITSFCIRAKSSKHSRLCSRNKRAAHGSPIDVLRNGRKVGFEIMY